MNRLEEGRVSSAGKALSGCSGRRGAESSGSLCPDPNLRLTLHSPGGQFRLKRFLFNVWG